MTIQQILKKSTDKLKQKNISSASLDAEVLLLETLNKTGIHSLKYNKSQSKKTKPAYRLKPELHKNKTWLYLNNNYRLNKDEEKLFNDFINQRLKNKPVAYIINSKEFYGYDFYVDENVLIPRPETELIVDEVLEILNNEKNKSSFAHFKRRQINACFPSFKMLNKNFTLIDIGTGSGCIIISILNKLKENRKDKIISNAFANDISQEAIKIARTNAKKYNLDQKIKFIASDLEKVLNKKILSDSSKIIITANLPYLKNDNYKKLQSNVKEYEPKTALMGGKDGLDLIKKLLNKVSKLQQEFKNKIFIILEADPIQINKIKNISASLFENAEFKIKKDLNQKKRIIIIKIG